MIRFVTHAIEGAIFLADRVAVTSPGPGRIVRDVHVDLPHRRDVSLREFGALRREPPALLHSHHARVEP